MTAHSHYDAIIVGGGPAGSACASVLGGHGIRVLLCEKAAFPREKICGDCLNPHAWNLLKLLGADDGVRRCAHNRITGIRIIDRHGTAAQLPAPSVNGEPFIAMKRSLLDNELFMNASRAGAELRGKTRVKAIGWNGRWEVTLGGGNAHGEATDVTCDILIGADGRNSIVRRILRNESEGSDRRRSRLSSRTGIQWHTEAQPLLGQNVELFLFDGGYCGMVNVDDRHTTIAMVTSNELAGLATQNFGQFLWRTLFSNREAAARFSHLEPIGAVRSAFPIDPRKFESRHRKARLIGDARQTVEPFTGEGVTFAMHDGIRTALTLLRKEFGRSPDTAIESRHRFWVNHVYSPLLRTPSIAGALVRVGARLPLVTKLAARPVF